MNLHMKKNLLKQLKYAPKIWSTVLYFIIVAIGMILFAARSLESLRFDFLLQLFPNYHQHISNFSITLLLVLVSGYTTTLENKSLKRTYITASILIAINVVYELYLPFINTRDIMDAYYGISGAVLPFLYLLPYQHFGIMHNPMYENNKSSEIEVI
ncbi:hypothetical protein EDC17_104421 [Sphingobacterium alimentarium]|uniref:VanZ like protein n=2 Tax=Sphingobacterium alimentarium TaxID=797292 RepID=A0A4R3VUZ2_9SPHI|nr:hypothetical protein EDC17_104421 [Sphingobacterium alimentarium]